MRRRGRAKGKPGGTTREGEHAGPADAISSARHCTTVRVCTGGSPRSGAGSTAGGGNGEVRTTPRPYRDRLDRGSRRHACRPQNRHEAAKLGQAASQCFPSAAAACGLQQRCLHSTQPAWLRQSWGSLQWLKFLVMLQRPQASKKNCSRPQPASAGRGQPSCTPPGGKKAQGAQHPRVRTASVSSFLGGPPTLRISPFINDYAP